MTDPKKIVIGVLAGGPSSERNVSLRSGKAVHEALRLGGYRTRFVDLKEISEKNIVKARIDAAFIVLHGGAGEDGTIQNILEKLEIPYTGSGPRASFRAMDKLESKRIFQDFKIPTPEYISVNRPISLENLSGLGLPLVIKPTREGSSIGLTVVKEKEAFDEAMNDAFKYGGQVLIEKFIEGRELTVGIVGERSMPVIEIRPKNEVYDFSAKYEDKETSYIVPAELTEDEKKHAQELAMRAHRALDCRDLSRVDIRMDKDGKMFVLEVNTIPGMTSRSLLPKAALADGIKFNDLCSMLLEFALGRRTENVAN